MKSTFLYNNKKFYHHPKLGNIPCDWIPKKGKECFKIFGSTSISSLIEDANGELLYMKVEDFNIYENSFYIQETSIKISSKSTTNGLIPLGSIVVSKRGEAIKKNRVRLVLKPTYLDPNLMAIKVSDGHYNMFFKYLIEQMGLQKFVEDSAIPQLNNKDFYPRLFVIPNSENEQKAIASILLKVDEAIKTTENSINATAKLKKGLMQNLLTGKLKPDGTWRSKDEFYKDEKFGNVPVGWVVKAIGDNSHCNINPNYKFIKGKEYDFIPMEAVNDSFGGVVSSLEKRIIDGGGYTRYKKGDILFAKITPCTENGKVALIKDCDTEVGFASTEFIVFSPKEPIDSLFFYYLISSSSVHMLAVSLMEGTTGRQRVPWKVFKNRIFASFPSDVSEQKEIAAIISKVETQNHRKTEKIDRLKRLKKALMQKLLTGKVRVDINKIEKLLQKETK